MESVGAQLRRKKKQELRRLNEVVKALGSQYFSEKQIEGLEAEKENIQDRISAISKELAEWEATK